MNKIILATLIVLSNSLWADCFITKDSKGTSIQEGECSARHSPCSTFKIPISLMGYNEGILIDAKHPVFPFKPGYTDWLEVWKQPHNPTMWIKNSCIWYSQVITKKLGASKFQAYVQKFDYGNRDVSGDPGKNNGLTSCWLSSSLQISPQEQITFLELLTQDKLPVSTQAHQLTRDLLFIQNVGNDWKLYGKTGSGELTNADGTPDRDHQIGWFVGWLQKGDRTITFAQYVQDKEKVDSVAGARAREQAMKRILLLSKS